MDLRDRLPAAPPGAGRCLRTLGLVLALSLLFVGATRAQEQADAGPVLEPLETIPARHYFFVQGLPAVTGTAPHPNVAHLLEAYDWSPISDPLSGALLKWYYEALLNELARDRPWPGEATRLESIHAFHHYAVEEDPAETADRMSVVLATRIRDVFAKGQVDLGWALLDSGIEAYGQGAAGATLLHVERAGNARLRGGHQRATEEVQLARNALEVLRARASHMDPDKATELTKLASRSECSLLLEEAAQHIHGGLAEDAYPLLSRANELALGLDSYRLSFDVALDRMNLAVGLDRVDDLRKAHDAFLAEVHKRGWDEQVRSGELARLTTRLGMGLAEAARIAGEPTRNAENALREALSDESLFEQDQALALYWLSDLLIDRGAVTEAFTTYERLVELHASAAVLAARSNTERLVLEARLAQHGLLPVQQTLLAATGALQQTRERWAEARLLEAGRGIVRTRDQLGLLEGVIGLHVGTGDLSAALLEVARMGEAGSLARLLGSGPWREESLDELIPAGGGLIVLVPGASQSWVLLADAAGMEAIPVASTHGIDRARRAFERGLMRLSGESQALERGHFAGIDAGFQEDLDGLANALAWDRYVARVSTWQRLRVVGADSGGCPPLEMLPASNGGLLGATLEITYLPSLAVGQALLARPPKTGGLVVLDAISALPGTSPGDLMPLVETGPDMGSSDLLLAGDTDSIAKARNAGCTLTFAGHGVDSGDLSRWIALLLDAGPPKRQWTAAQIEEGSCPDYVELIACGTWRGRLRRGDDGRQYLYGAFLAAGAHTVLTSQEPLVADVAIPEVTSLHRHLRWSGRPAAALLRMRQEAPPEHGVHPYLMHVVGLDRVLEPWIQDGLSTQGSSDAKSALLKPASRSYWIGSAVLLLGLAGLWASRRSRPTQS